MATLKITPHEGKFIVINPVTNEDFFVQEDGSHLQGIFNIVGSSSKQFYEAVNNIGAYKALTEEESGNKILAAMIVGWEDNGFIEEQYSVEEALNLINDPANRWIVGQLQEYVNDQRNFF